MDPIAYAFTGGWAAGINAYATVLVLGLVGRAELADTPEVFQRTDVLIVLAVFTVVEFAVDKIPYVDSLWDMVHTIVRPIVGGVIGWLIVDDTGAGEHVMLAALAGFTALASHSAKSGIRLSINASPEPASTMAVSAAENAILLGMLLLLTQQTLLATGIALAILVIMLGMALLLRRRIRRGWELLRARYFPDPRAAP